MQTADMEKDGNETSADIDEKYAKYIQSIFFIACFQFSEEVLYFTNTLQGTIVQLEFTKKLQMLQLFHYYVKKEISNREIYMYVLPQLYC